MIYILEVKWAGRDKWVPIPESAGVFPEEPFHYMEKRMIELRVSPEKEDAVRVLKNWFKSEIRLVIYKKE